MPCQSEVVVRAEHDDALAINDRLGALVAVESFVKRVETEGLRRLYKGEVERLLKNITAIGVVVNIRRQRVDVDGLWNAFIYKWSCLGGQRVGPFPFQYRMTGQQGCEPLWK